jgi:hypothetical protein
LDNHDTSLNTLDTRVDTIDTSMGVVDTRLDDHDTSLNTLDTRVDTIDTSMGVVDTRLDNHDTSLNTLDTRVDTIDTSLNNIDSSLTTFITRTDASFDKIGARTPGSNIQISSDVSFTSDVRIGGNLIIDGSFIKTNDLSVNIIGANTESKLQFSSDVSFNHHISGRDASFEAVSIKQLMGYSPIEVMHDLCLNSKLIATDASFNRIGALDGSLAVTSDISVNGSIFFSNNLYQNGELFSGSNTSDASFNVIQEFMDGSGITFLSDVSFNQHATFKDVSINRIGPVDGSLIIMGDLSVNGNIFVSGGAIGGGGGSGTDASFDRIGEFTDGSGISFLNDVSMNTRLVVPDASFNRIGPIDGSLVVVGDLSVNGNVKFSGDIFANNLNGTLQKITIFDDISCTTTNGVWRDIPQSRDFAAGTVLIHDITVSSSIDSGYIDWPEGGHKYILSRSELTNGYQDFETFKYIFDSQNVSEEIKHTFVENITNNSTYSDWKLTISGDGVVTDASDNLKWETIVINPVAITASSHIENYTLFDASAASSVTTDTIWEASNSIEIPQGSMVFHDIKVSGYIGDGYVDWPLAGHEFNFDRKKGGSYTWDHSKSYEQVKHVFTSRNAHEEQTYSILETVAETNTYTQWRCDFSGSGGLTDANDKLTWKMTVITPGDYNIRNDYERIKRLEIFNGAGSSAGNPYPPYWHAAQTLSVAPGTIMIHNIKVASRIQTSFVNWPDGGHQYNIYRVDNSSNGYGVPVETFKYIFDGREDLEEATYTFTEIIDNTSTFVDWKIDVSGEGVENDTSNILSWDVALITPKLLTAAPASLMTTHNVFDNVSYDGASSWDISSNPVINVPKGSIVLHDIKVSGKIATGYVDWPLSGHEFIFQRRYNGDNGGYTWNGDVNKTYEHVKHIFTGQGVHEEQDYTMIEKHTTQNRDFTRWKCDLSGNGAALDSNDTLNWTVTVITPSEFNHLNDICYGQVVPATMLTGTIPAGRIPGDLDTYVQTGSLGGSMPQDIYGEKSFKNDVDISGKLVVDGDVSFNAHLSAVDASFQNNVDISGKLVVDGDVSFNAHLSATDASFQNNVDISGKLVVKDDVSFNAHLSATDASFQNNVEISGSLVVAGPTTGEAHSYGAILYLLDTPIDHEWSWDNATAGSTSRITYNSSELPANCKAVLCEVFMPKSNPDDHVGHSLGKNYSAAVVWKSGHLPADTESVFTLRRQTTFLDMRGQDDDFEYYYGKWFSSVIIPLDTGNNVYHIIQGESTATSSWVYVVTRGYYI